MMNVVGGVRASGDDHADSWLTVLKLLEELGKGDPAA